MIFEVIDTHGNALRFDSVDRNWSTNLLTVVEEALWDPTKQDVVEVGTEVTIRRIS